MVAFTVYNLGVKISNFPQIWQVKNISKNYQTIIVFFTINPDICKLFKKRGKKIIHHVKNL